MFSQCSTSCSGIPPVNLAPVGLDAADEVRVTAEDGERENMVSPEADVSSVYVCVCISR